MIIVVQWYVFFRECGVTGLENAGTMIVTLEPVTVYRDQVMVEEWLRRLMKDAVMRGIPAAERIIRVA